MKSLRERLLERAAAEQRYAQGGGAADLLEEAAENFAQDSIIEAVRQKLLDRSVLGVRKYGTTLADSKQQLIEKLVHAQEEAMDLCNYLEWAIQELKSSKDN